MLLCSIVTAVQLLSATFILSLTVLDLRDPWAEFRTVQNKKAKFSSEYKRYWEKYLVILAFYCGVLFSSWFLRSVFMILDVNPICLYCFCQLSGQLSRMSLVLVVGISKGFLFAKISWDHIQACTSLLNCYSNAILIIGSSSSMSLFSVVCNGLHSRGVYVWLSCYGRIGLTKGIWHFPLLVSLFVRVWGLLVLIVR